MPEAYQLTHKGNVIYGFFPKLASSGSVTHGMSTRQGGVSLGRYHSLNLAYNSDDDPASVKENYRIFTAALQINQDQAVLTHQTHNTNIMNVSAIDMGKGISRPKDYDSVDGLITNVPGIPLLTFHADCVPLFFVDPVTKTIGLAHIGWKGTVHQLAVKMVDRLKSDYGVTPGDLLVAIGPSISECCFVIRSDVRQELLDNLPFSEKLIQVVREGQWRVSLQKINRVLLQQAGVDPSGIIDSGVCTCCHSDIYFSHRAQGSTRGTMAAMLQLNQ